jgi:Gas vesicle synthesis protein GvpL/GvpF.
MVRKTQATSQSKKRQQPEPGEQKARPLNESEQYQKNLSREENRKANAESPPKRDKELPAPDPARSSRGLYAYGLVEKGANCNGIVGIDNKNNVYAIEGSSVSILVSEIDIQHFQRQVQELYNEIANSGGILQEQSGEILQAHENVIDRIMQQYTIIPLKFGTILKSKSSALMLLRSQETYFRSLLEKFRGKAECGVKVYADQQALMQYLAQTEKREKTQQEGTKNNLSRGTAYL